MWILIWCILVNRGWRGRHSTHSLAVAPTLQPWVVHMSRGFRQQSSASDPATSPSLGSGAGLSSRRGATSNVDFPSRGWVPWLEVLKAQQYAPVTRVYRTSNSWLSPLLLLKQWQVAPATWGFSNHSRTCDTASSGGTPETALPAVGAACKTLGPKQWQWHLSTQHPWQQCYQYTQLTQEADAQVMHRTVAPQPVENLQRANGGTWVPGDPKSSRSSCSLVTPVATTETAVTLEAEIHQQSQRHKQHNEGTDYASSRGSGGWKVQAFKYNQKQLRTKVTKALPKYERCLLPQMCWQRIKSSKTTKNFVTWQNRKKMTTLQKPVLKSQMITI